MPWALSPCRWFYQTRCQSDEGGKANLPSFPSQPRPAGAESSESEELQLFSLDELDPLTPEKLLSPIPSGSDKPMEDMQRFEDDKQKRFLKTRPIRDFGNLFSHITQERVARLETLESEHSSSVKEVPVFHHNVATVWTALKPQVRSLLKQKSPGKARALSFEPRTPVSQSRSWCISCLFCCIFQIASKALTLMWMSQGSTQSNWAVSCKIHR